MSYLAQIILAARNTNGKDTGWMQLMALVIIAVFYVVGSIVKAKANKAEQQGEEQLPRKPVHKPREAVRGLPKQSFQQSRPPAGPAQRRPYRPQIQPAGRKVMRPQPVAQKLAAETERAIQLGSIKPLKEPEPSLLGPQVQPDFQELAGLTGKTIKRAETPQAKYLAEVLLDYADPDELKRAILHYEILGKPLSLRSPSGHITGF